MDVINILSILRWRNRHAHIYTNLGLLTSSLELQHAGWMSAYGSVCIVVIVILMTD